MRASCLLLPLSKTTNPEHTSQYKLVDDPQSKMSIHGRISQRIKNKILSSNLNKLCDRFEIKLQGKQAGNNSNIFDEKIVAITTKVLKN